MQNLNKKVNIIVCLPKNNQTKATISNKCFPKYVKHNNKPNLLINRLKVLLATD